MTDRATEPNYANAASTGDGRVIVWGLQDVTQALNYLAEQQRIANLIALAGLHPGKPLRDQVAEDALYTLTDYHTHNAGGWLQLKPDIATALGVTINDN